LLKTDLKDLFSWLRLLAVYYGVSIHNIPAGRKVLLLLGFNPGKCLVQHPLVPAGGSGGSRSLAPLAAHLFSAGACAEHAFFSIISTLSAPW